MANDIPDLEFPPLSEQFMDIAERMIDILHFADVDERVTIIVDSSNQAAIKFSKSGTWYTRLANEKQFTLIEGKR